MKFILSVAFVALLACPGTVAAAGASPVPDLLHATRANDRGAVRSLLKTGADLTARDELGDTPLMSAALYADAAVLELLIGAGADVNAANPAGVTALMRAATFEDKSRLLVLRGADVKARSALGNTALILAARKVGNARTVRLLLDHGADANATNRYGATALMAAAAAEDVETVRLLLDRGADVNAKPNMDGDGFIWGGGRTALMWAAFLGNEALVRVLLERGAKVNDFTVAGGALGQSAWGGHAGVARVLLGAGAQVDQPDLFANYTPLHWAASSERSDTALVDLLLARGATVNAEGGQPVDNFLGVTQTPLALARKRGETPIVRALLKAGAKESPPTANVRGAKSGVAGSATVAEAIQRALPSLQTTAAHSATTFVRHASKQECISCHQQQLPLAAVSLAQSRHFATDRDAARHQLVILKKDLSSAAENDLQAAFHPEPAIFAGYAALNLTLEREASSRVTDAMVHQLATIQHADGHWSWNLPRPPIQASDLAATALAVQTIKSVGIPARKRELESRVARARHWLRQASAESNEERVHQLLGLAWAGEKSGSLKKLARALIGAQRPDGGWGQLAGLESDAYATGQALYALQEGARIAANDPAIRRGIDFLLRTQLADGTWHVRRRAHPFQPPMESSFPHGADGWISAAGTSWAVMALATATDPSPATPFTPVLARTAAGQPAAVAAAESHAQSPVEFTRDIQPLLERSCVACHSGERAKGGFLVTAREALIRGGNRGEPAVVAGRADQSPLIRVVADQVEDLEMPPLGKRERFPALTKDETARLRAWINQGAVWPDGATVRPPGN